MHTTYQTKLKWEEADEKGLTDFLVGEKGFNAERVASSIAKLKKARSGTVQGRLDGFFKPTVKPVEHSAPTSTSSTQPPQEPSRKRTVFLFIFVENT